MKKHIVYLWVLVVMWGCNSSKTTTQDNNDEIVTTKQEVTSNPVVIKFTQTPCFGSCPSHEMKIHLNGDSYYWGKQNVSFQGKFETAIPENKVKEVLYVADSIEFFDLDSAYIAKMTDLPTTIIFIQNGDKSHQVRAYGPVPDNLKFFIEYLYDFSQGISWRGEE